MNEKEVLINNAARNVLALTRDTLIVRFRFLDIALSRLEPVAKNDTTYATDGGRLIYGPSHVLRSFRSDREKPVHDYLHIVLHCIFRHMFIGSLADRELWDLACDIAVESILSDLGLRIAGIANQIARDSEVERLRAEVRMLTAEKIYHYYLESDLPGLEIARLRRLFEVDDHSGWHSEKSRSNNDTPERNGSDRDGRLPDRDSISAAEDIPDGVDPENTFPQHSPLEELADEWKKIAEKIQEDLETFSREQGDAAGGLVRNLKAVNRERYDYTNFLKKFSVLGETIGVNDEEFDYIYYTYGLRLYGNMPLVEPLEYREVKRVREFVIAVDTSASTSGELVQKFLRKTYNILKSTENFFSRVNIHIIQCDAAIQEHVRITSEEELDDYISSMEIRGLGGTDFRPVFGLVDKLIEDGKFRDLKGMIYFTDGRGTFPARKPGYETAFVFLDNEYNDPDVPLWAIKIVLQDEELL